MKTIAIIEVPEGGKGKWYIDGEIRYTENESLKKKFDKELIPLKPMPEKMIPEMVMGNKFAEGCVQGWNDCIDTIVGETE